MSDSLLRTLGPAGAHCCGFDGCSFFSALLVLYVGQVVLNQQRENEVMFRYMHSLIILLNALCYMFTYLHVQHNVIDCKLEYQ